MRKKTKIWLIIAVFLVLAGGIIFGGVMTMLKWDFTKLSTSTYETNTHIIEEDFQAIQVACDTADITFVPAETASVVCYERANETHSVTVADGSLVIEMQDTRKWYEHIGINFGTPKITVYIPEGEYGALSVKASTGDVEIAKEFQFESIAVSTSTGTVKNQASALGRMQISTSTGGIRVEGVRAGEIDLSVSTGKIIGTAVVCEGNVGVRVSTGAVRLTDVTCKNVTSSGSTGSMIMQNVIAAEKFSIERSTGDVQFDGCDAAEIFVETDTGDVSGTLLSEKVFLTETDTGTVNVPKSVTGGRCEVKTDTGDIHIQIQ